MPLCIHQDWTRDKSVEFILRSQLGHPDLPPEAKRKLRDEWIATLRRMGVPHDAIARRLGICAQTARNAEGRLAADSNSKFGNTKTDARRTASTDENLAKARRLRAEGKNDSEIARLLGVSVATAGKWRKADERAIEKEQMPQAGGGAAEGGKGKKIAAARPMEPTSLAAPPVTNVDSLDGGVPQALRLFLESRRDGSRLQEAYAARLEHYREEAEDLVKKFFGNINELANTAFYHRAAAAAAERHLYTELRRNNAEKGVA